MSKKGGGSQVVTTAPDPATAQYQQQVRDAANQAANTSAPGISPETQSAIDLYGQYMRGGNLGFGALNGDPTAIAAYMNPYQQNVVDATKAQYGDLRDQTIQSLNDQATQAGAFGGSRAAVAQGAALGQLGLGEQQQLASLEQSGYNDAMSRAATSANLGFGAGQQVSSLGDYERNVQMQQNPALWRLQMLNQVPFGSSGSTQTATATPGHNGLTGALGGAATGAGIASALKLAGPWGWAATGLGGLLGLFG